MSEKQYDKVYTVLGARNFAKEDRQNEDYYATPRHAVECLLKEETFQNEILEPCCGEGHIAKILSEHGYKTTSFDLIDRGYGSQKDFLTMSEKWKGDLITNPPYKNSLDFVEKALDVVEDGSKVAMLLRIQFLEGKKRRAFFEKHPPQTVYVASNRFNCAKNGDFENGGGESGGAMCFAWFVWVKGFKGDPTLKWIN